MKDKARRKFLKQSIGLGAAGAALLARPISAAAYSRVLGANDRIRVALIGCGGMGRSDLRDFLKVKDVECVALCDVDDSQVAEGMKKIVEPTSQTPGLTTRDFRKVLDMKELEAVIVATPDHWHALPMVMACQAGKDVYVEKPLSVSIGEGRVMVDVARKHDRVVQMGTQQRSAPHYADAVDYVKSGKLGRVRLVRAWAYLDWKGETPVQPDAPVPAGVDYDMWLGPARKRPFNLNRFHFTFRWYWDYSGGLMTDWGAHMIDIANWAMGIKAPSSAVSIGGKFGYPNDAMETPDTQQVMWAFPGFSMIWEHALGVGRGPEAREHGVQFHGEQGVLVVERGGWEVYPETDRIDKPGRIYKSAGVPRRSASGDMHLLHVQNFIDCMRSRKRPNSDLEIGHNSMIACHLGNIAQRLGRQVKWDVEKEMIIGDKEAQSHVLREYRAPWKLVT
ncbi:MAG: Gfo/Idh/MocA family oxidoreductase [Acidobacteria bacterium]|nr:Gfo/Idh/MocA family oxidoreductase [Acidobacteriota bacterium]MCI0719677.1 Gfo/Idh/MocA family oxidoreductase [Acidobacteriota bacterium]